MDGPVRTRPAPSGAIEALWHVDAVGAGQYEGWCREGALRRVFGGQVAAQAVAAAAADLAGGWAPTSLHAYFVREGRSAEPVEYRVDRLDAGEQRLRRVTAAQAGRPILILDTALAPAADLAPANPAHVAPPSTLDGGWAPTPDEARWLVERSTQTRFELRFLDRPTALAGRRGEAADGQRFWLRPVRPLPDAALQHACALTYASDMLLVSTALARHGLPGRRTDIQAASLDHAVWFHRPVRADEWVLYEQRGATAAGGRGLSTGRLLDRSGEVVATVRQEVLQRIDA